LPLSGARVLVHKPRVFRNTFQSAARGWSVLAKHAFA
jgi:hypothetical protein